MVMSRGGSRPGAGRPRGSKNKINQELAQAVEREGLSPLGFLLDILRNESLDVSERLQAAKIACPYVHPRIYRIAARIDEETLQEAEPNERSVTGLLEEILQQF